MCSASVKLYLLQCYETLGTQNNWPDRVAPLSKQGPHTVVRLALSIVSDAERQRKGEQISLPSSQNQLYFPHPRANLPSSIPEPTCLPPSQNQLAFPHPRANFRSPTSEPTCLQSSQSQFVFPKPFHPDISTLSNEKNVPSYLRVIDRLLD
ncbi:hypothetical protein PoB_000038800 [Plakobranchus ocellatus]|uniref:Uncharacterized protein n=1 Tax=Plakobranchus ocellatus TaxID=259542 RepID=A0AAV3XV75_9GAST|nr:hypothetical protein PoB_000038800 [Plakobranchus ocellatus]